MKLKPIDWKSWFRSFIIAATLVWVVSATLISPKVISLSSMEPSLFPGDLVLVNKWQLGARTPISIGIPFTKYQLPNTTLPSNRLPGLGKLERGNIVLFNYPLDTLVIDRKKLRVKRLIALPGDTIAIRKLSVFINGEMYKEEYPVLINYELNCSSKELEKVMRLVSPASQKVIHSNENLHIINLSKNELQSVNSQFPDIKITPTKHGQESFISRLLPAKNNKSWTTDNLGPLYIPKKGDSIKLDAENLLLYNRIIKNYEQCEMKNVGDSIFIDGNYSAFYKFKQDYYFTMGDNRYNSIDSRHWGLLPEDHIIGKIEMVLFSFDPKAQWLDKIRWSKILHTPE